MRERPVRPSYRQVTVKGSGGVAASIIIRVRRGTVWFSLEPLFTWEAMLDPAKVDEFILALQSARDEARRMPQDSATKRAEACPGKLARPDR